MSTPLRRIENDTDRREAISRRIASNSHGLGYWSAIESHKDPAVLREALAAQRKANPSRVWDSRG